MRSRFVRQALEEYVARRAPTPPDVWPAVQQRVGAGRPLSGRIQVQPTASRGGMRMTGAVLLVLVALFLGAGLGVDRLLPQRQGIYGSAPTLPQAASTGAATTSAVEEKTNTDPYAALFTRNLAAQLGLDEARLNAAVGAAMNDTVAQAVRDGKMDEAAVTKFKTAAQGGLSNLLPSFTITDDKNQAAKGPKLNDETGILLKAGLAAVPQALGMSEADYTTANKTQSIMEIAQARNVSVDTLKAAILTAARAAADAQVRAGTWTQAQADTAYAALNPQLLDDVLKAPPDARSGLEADERWNILSDAAFAAGAQMLGLTATDLQAALKQDQSLSDLAQAHQVDLDALKTAMLGAARTAADAQVRSGTWTQADADSLYAKFSDSFVQKLFVTNKKEIK